MHYVAFISMCQTIQYMFAQGLNVSCRLAVSYSLASSFCYAILALAACCLDNNLGSVLLGLHKNSCCFTVLTLPTLWAFLL